MDYSALCEKIADTNESVLGLIVVNQGKLAGHYIRPKTPFPSKNKFEKLFVQAEIMASVPTTNEDVFGKVEFTMVRHGNMDIFIIPFSNVSNNKTAAGRKVLAFAVARPCDIESLTKEVAAILKSL